MGQLPHSASSTCDFSPPSLPIIHHHQLSKPHVIIPASKGRTRSLTVAFPVLTFPLLSSSSSSSASSSSIPIPKETVPHLNPYTDTNEGFTLLIPSSWNKVEKAGATALFEEGKGIGSNTIGVVVSPVRLSSLPDFGTPQFVADKLIGAERRKESTKQAQLVAVAERLGRGGLPVYEFEYTVDSTRGGMKRIFSAAFVALRKLYLLNISYSDRPDNPLDGQKRMILEKVLHSFDTAAL